MRLQIAIPLKRYVPALETTLASILVAHCFHTIDLRVVVQVSSPPTSLPVSAEKVFDTLKNRNIDFEIRFAPDGGVSQALNSAFSSQSRGTATGQSSFLAYLGHGDLLSPSAFRHLADIAKLRPDISWFTGAAAVLDQNGDWSHLSPRPESHSLVNFLENKFFVQAEGTFFSEETFWSVGGFNEEVSVAFDFDLWLRLLRKTPLHFLTTTTGAFSLHEGQLSENMNDYLAEAQSLVRSFLEDHRLRDLQDFVFFPEINAAWIRNNQKALETEGAG